MINRLVVRHGSDILQDTQDYNKIASLLSDIQGTKSVNGLVQGRSGVGARVGVEIAPVTASITTVKEFCIPLMGVLSSSTLKALPLHAMKNAPLTIELYFEKARTALANASNATLADAEVNKLTSFKVK